MPIQNVPYDSQPVILEAHDTLKQALSLMVAGNAMVPHSSASERTRSAFSPNSGPKSYVLVAHQSKLLGILTERDFVRLSLQDLDFESITVGEVMTANVLTVTPQDLDQPIALIQNFRKARVRHLPVLNHQGQILGVVTYASIRQSLCSADLLRSKTVAEIMTRAVVTAPLETDMPQIAQMMRSHRVSCVVICQGGHERSQCPVGIVTERDIVKLLKRHLTLVGLKSADVMSHPLHLLAPTQVLWEAHEQMQALKIRRMVVAEGEVLQGLITQSSILDALDITEIHHTVELLNREVNRLKSEKVQLLERQTQKLASKAASAEQRFQAIFNQTFQFIGLLEPDGTMIEVNQTALNFGGVTREDVVGRKFWDADWWSLSSRTQQDLRAAIAQAAQGEFVRYEVEVLGVNNQRMMIDFSLRPIFDSDGHVTFLIPEGRDISDRKQAELVLQKQRDFERLMCRISSRLIKIDAIKMDAVFNEILAELGTFFRVETCFLFQRLPQENLFQMSHEWINSSFQSRQALAQSISMKRFPWSLMQLQENSIVAVDNVQSLPESASLDAENWQEFGLASLVFVPIYVQANLTAWVGFANFSQSRVWSRSERRRLRMISEVFANALERIHADRQLRHYQENLEELVQVRTQALQASEERFQLALAGTEDGIFDWDLENQTIYLAPRFKAILGYEDHELDHQPDYWKAYIYLRDRDRVLDAFHCHLEHQYPFDVEYRIYTRDGQIRWVHSLGSATRNEQGVAIRFVGSIRDIHLRKEMEMNLFREKELAQITLHSIGDAVITTDADGRIEYFNTMAERLTGWSPDHAIGQPIQLVCRLVHEDTNELLDNPIFDALLQGETIQLSPQAALISKNGIRYSIQESAAPIRSKDGTVMGAVMIFQDVTDARQMARKLSWQASHDALTQLLNRREFEYQLRQVLQKESLNQQHVLCFLDLDRFKVVNDTCGHLAGDELLRQVSQLFQSHVRSRDLLARLGGDEFGILLRDCELTAACGVAEKIRDGIERYRFPWANQRFSIGISIGLVQINQDHPGIEELLSAADAACYAAKERGRNRVHVYQLNDMQLQQQREERQWSLKIKQALAENNFCLYCQQIVAAQSSLRTDTYHAEILVRMRDQNGALIAPGAFLSAAERYDLMPALDRWVISQGLCQIAQIKAQNRLPSLQPRWMINLSGASLGDESLMDFIKEQIAYYQLPPSWIGFEITETAAIANLDQANHFIRALQQIGCYFALDDFGSGMSSFGYLKSLPVNYLKIDGQFIGSIVEDRAIRAMVEAINHVGHVMQIQTVAEWVETPQQQKALAEIGVDWIQGFGVYKPQPLLEVSASCVSSSSVTPVGR